MNIEKLYPGTPVCVSKNQQNFVAGVASSPGAVAPVPDPGLAPLGRYANFIDPPSFDPLSICLQEPDAVGPDRPASMKAKAVRAKLQGLRAERYRLLSEARSILLKAGRALGLEHPGNFHKTAKCKHISHGQVSVNLAPEFGAAFFGGLVTCGNVWTCPVCSVKIQERRREEIQQGIDWAYTQRMQPVMFTFTFPHGRHHKLGRLLDQQAEALRLMRQGSPWKRFKKKWGYEAVIRSLELTYGDHGWHPHTHELWLLSKHTTTFDSSKEDVEAEVVALRQTVLERWEYACIKAGLLKPAKVDAFREYAVHVKPWCSAGDYLAKQDDSRNWGVDREMSKATSKTTGKLKGLHPFAFLAKAAEGDLRAARLFLTFALAIKGKHQLEWSAGLKGRVGLKEKSDQQHAVEKRENADLLGLLGTGDWQRVRLNRCQADILDAAENGGWPAVRALLDRLLKHAKSGLSPLKLREAAKRAEVLVVAEIT